MCPETTVFIPTYNSLERLKKACHSVWIQNSGVCLHVLDNGSVDGTRDWLVEMAKIHSGLRLTLRNQNIGVMANYRDGFESCETEFCVPLASDDLLQENFIQTAIAVARKDDSLGAVICETDCCKSGAVAFTSPSDFTEGRREPLVHLREWISTGHYFSWSGILWRTEALRRVNAGREFERFGFCGDAWVQYLVFEQYPVYLSKTKGALLQMHGDQVSRKACLETVQEITGMLDELKTRILNLDSFSPKEREEMVLTAFRHWASVLRWVLWKSGKAFADEDARQALDLYTKSIYPVIGFNNFALLPAFQAFRDQARPDAIHKLKWMENSLSWRVTAPLRLSLDWLKHRLRRVGIA
jgi:glycosyltransferase involved in cell wall biosynthesis